MTFTDLDFILVLKTVHGLKQIFPQHFRAIGFPFLVVKKQTIRHTSEIWRKNIRKICSFDFFHSETAL